MQEHGNGIVMATLMDHRSHDAPGPSHCAMTLWWSPLTQDTLTVWCTKNSTESVARKFHTVTSTSRASPSHRYATSLKMPPNTPNIIPPSYRHIPVEKQRSGCTKRHMWWSRSVLGGGGVCFFGRDCHEGCVPVCRLIPPAVHSNVRFWK